MRITRQGRSLASYQQLGSEKEVLQFFSIRLLHMLLSPSIMTQWTGHTTPSTGIVTLVQIGWSMMGSLFDTQKERMLQVKTNLFKLHFKFKAYFYVHQLITLRQGRSRKTVLGADLWQIGQTAVRNCRGKGNQLKREKSWVGRRRARKMFENEQLLHRLKRKILLFHQLMHY